MKIIFSIQCRYSLSDPKAQSIVRLITESVQVENLRFLFNLPWTRHLFPEGTIQELRNHWTEWVGSENGHFCLLLVHQYVESGWVRKSPKDCLFNN